MDTLKRKLLIVCNNDNYVGLLSIGDIQRVVINNHSFTDAISSIMRNDYIVSHPDESIDEVKQRMLQLRTEFMPVVDSFNNLVHLHFWEKFFGKNENKKPEL